GLDATSFPQAMFSRPLIAATLAGWAFGRPGAGLLLGALVEIFSLVILPFGAARYPESGTAAAAAAAAYTATEHTGPPEPLLLLALVFALAWEQVAGASVIFTRRLNERLVPYGTSTRNFSARQVAQRHLLAMAIDFVRGGWAVVLGALIGVVLLRVFEGSLQASPGLSIGLILTATATMLGCALPLFGGFRQRWLSLGLGLLCGTLLLVLK
ncbi:MAG: PTS sugar transporter subunit IIC, partial [Gemmatimonadota bacterium]